VDAHSLFSFVAALAFANCETIAVCEDRVLLSQDQVTLLNALASP